jgi:hypothetical protein
MLERRLVMAETRRTKRITDAMMMMVKLDTATLECAYRGN